MRQKKNLPKVLVIEDDMQMLENYSRILRRFGYECIMETTSTHAIENLESLMPDIILTDLRMPHGSGFDVISAVQRYNPDIPVVLITAYADIPTAVEAIKMGAYDVIAKPFTSEQLEIVIERALRQKLLKDENRRLREQLKGTIGGELVAKSPAMREILGLIERISRTEANVLITGESGTGKEMVARMIHQKSQRAHMPFIPVDCAAIPENLIESELFGYEKGAFTGATNSREGLFEAANNGTVFLDEVGELPVVMQSKLLRLLQERKVRRLGSNRFISLNVRIISATNRDLGKSVSEGLFREDLYYRLNVINIHLPPLRERREDIPVMALHFLKQYSVVYEKNITSISAEVMELLEGYRWPGNVRELQNLIERAVILCNGERLTLQDIPGEFHTMKNGMISELTPYQSAKEAFEKQYLQKLIKSVSGNISRAARVAGLNRRTIYRLMKKHGL
ncbi:MAG: sigma-54-dependent Fis family transcriptional regulator [Nitrospirae bacterium]|nr:sigma-54-dependent Fis family transcriptional regulator [Nitrospirota bacterium]